MSDLAFTPSPRSSNPEPGLRPERALLTPTWVGALALLVANDHWFKGSGLLPDVLTGKLSDFAGMLVAPVLLASLLRVKGKRGLLACHLAVAAVFAGIQLSAGFASQWSALMATVGHPWTITCDPTDLIALPFLLLSWKLLVPEMDGAKPALVPLQRTAVAGLSVFGLWSTVATSEFDQGVDINDEWYEDVYGNVYINNPNDFEISLYIRPLRGDIEVECGEVLEEPGRLLADAAFGEAQHWTLPPETNVAFDSNDNRACAAAMVGGEGIQPQIIFFETGEYGDNWFPGQTFDPADLGRAGMAIEFDADGGGSQWIGGEELRYTPTTSSPEQPESCGAPSAESRLDWSPVPTSMEVEVLGLSAGLDGCFEFDLQPVTLANNEPSPVGDPRSWYLCAPADIVPFEVGDILAIEELLGKVERELSVTLVDPLSFEPAVDPSGRLLLQVAYLRGGHDPSVLDGLLERELVALPRFDCPFMLDDACPTAERTVDLAVNGGQSTLSVGQPVSYADQNADPSAAMTRTVLLSYARERAVLDATCSPGSNLTDYDLDLAVMLQPL